MTKKLKLVREKIVFQIYQENKEELTLTELASIFKMSVSNVHRIIKKRSKKK